MISSNDSHAPNFASYARNLSQAPRRMGLAAQAISPQAVSRMSVGPNETRLEKGFTPLEFLQPRVFSSRERLAMQRKAISAATVAARVVGNLYDERIAPADCLKNAFDAPSRRGR